MNTFLHYVCKFLALFLFGSLAAQSALNADETPLFMHESPLPIKLDLSIKEIKSETNDSTYVVQKLAYRNDGVWDSMNVEIRKRGNYRLSNCYFPPLKLKIKKKYRKNTIFEKDKKLKLVLPCLLEKDYNDNIVKEYLAYKIFEKISPYHFDVRLLDVTLVEKSKRKNKIHKIKGFFIEDIGNLEDRYGANELIQKKVHPLAQDNLCSVRNDLFQFMIGNTDFSSAYGHNEKLLFVQGKTIPIPYDFDMSGLVNPSYGVVSQIGDKTLPISDVTQRYFRGFKRTLDVYTEARNVFLTKREDIFNTISDSEPFFDNKAEYNDAKQYIIDFFKIIDNDRKFEEQILKRTRKN